MVVSIGIVIVQ